MFVIRRLRLTLAHRFPTPPIDATLREERSRVSSWQAAGPHRYAVTGDEIRWEAHGPVHPPEAHVFAQLLLRVSSQYGRAYCIVDGRDLQPIPSESRRIYVEYLKQHRPAFALAIFGATLPIRVAGTLVVHAARLLSLGELNVYYSQSESEAAAYLQAQRRSLQ